MKIHKVIETEKEHQAALKRVDEIFTAKAKTKEAEELKLLLVLIEKYEDEHFPINLPDPIEAIKIRMDDLGLTAKDLIDAIGDKGTVSKVLNKKIPLSLRMIRNLSVQLNLPTDILLQEIELINAA